MAEPRRERGPWLNRGRLTGYATLFAITEIGLFAFCVAGAHGLIVPMDHKTSTDFLSFHAAGALTAAGTPWLAYDRAAHEAAETAAVGFASAYNYFYYPPIFLLVCGLLARLPYLVAFVAFQAVSAVACFGALRLIRKDLPLPVFLAFPGVWWAIGTGQNALLTAALFAAGTALLDRRPWLAGLCLGALCYKPHVALLVPVALIAGGYWRAVLGAAASVIGLAALSLALFGVRTWEAFLRQATTAGDVYGGRVFMGGMTSPYGMLMTLGAGRTTAVAVQAVVILAAILLVAIVWRRRAPMPVRAGLLLAATPVAVPVLMFYDLMLVLAALVWLTLIPLAPKAAGRRAAIMALVFLGALFSGNLGDEMRWMTAAISAALACGLSLALARPYLTRAEAAPSGRLALSGRE
jgi:hypothetical protein